MSAPRRILITGAASGIGAATARRLAGPDVSLFLTTAKNAAGLEAVAAEAQSAGARVETGLADLAEAKTAGDLVAAAIDRFGGLDQIVSNAGRADKRPFGAFSRADLEESFAVNTFPFLGLVDAALPHLQSSDWARVVFISSFVNHDVGINGTIFPLTAAAKGAVEGLARTLAYQVAAKGITVNGVAPGFTEKDGGHAALGAAAWEAAAKATPSGRIARPADIAAAVAFLLSREAEHITGQILRVDGGLSLL